MARLRGRRALGISQRQGPDGIHEWETHTCFHCNAVMDTKVQDTADSVGGYCPRCNSVVCKACAQKQVCTPFVDQIDKNLRQQARRRAMGL